MSENSSDGPVTKLSSSAPMCLCELTIDQKGKWQLKPESSAECVATLESMAGTLGPNSREYLATHIAPKNPEIEEAVKKLRDPNQKTE